MLFKLMFIDNSTGYFRVPLATFASEQAGKCLLSVFGGSDRLVMGGMFFE
jgi:hypothetical protein